MHFPISTLHTFGTELEFNKQCGILSPVALSSSNKDVKFQANPFDLIPKMYVRNEHVLVKFNNDKESKICPARFQAYCAWLCVVRYCSVMT